MYLGSSYRILFRAGTGTMHSVDHCLRCIREMKTTIYPLERKTVFANISLPPRHRTWMGFNFVRTLTKHARRSVPFPLAQRLHERFIGSPNIDRTPTTQGLKLLDNLNQSGKTKETQLKQLDTEELISILYSSTGMKRITGTAGGIVKGLYGNSQRNDATGTDLNLLVQYELGQRMKSTELKTLLSAADAVFFSQTQTFKFLSVLFDHLLMKFDDLSFSAQDITSIMFFIYLYGDAPEGLLLKLEEHLAHNLDNFSLNQVGIIFLGFFRANKRITNYSLLNNIAEKLLKQLDQIHPDNVTNILKTFRHSGFAKETFLVELAQALADGKLKKTSSLNQIMHLAMVFSSLKIYHKDLLSAMVLQTKTFLNQIKPSKVRTKDLGRLIWALGTFNHYDKELMERLVIPVFESNRSTFAYTLYPESFVDVAMGMVYLGVYPNDIIDLVLSPEVAAKLRDHRLLEKSSQLLFLNNSVQIEHPNYRGHLLSNDFIRTLSPKAYGDIEREMSFRHGLKAIYQALMKLLGQDCVACHFILPHFHTADLEINIDENRRPVHVGASCGIVELINQSSTNMRIVIEVIGKNQCTLNGDMLLGSPTTKLRQLHKLAYETHLIMPEEAKKLEDMTTSDIELYLSNLLTTRLNVHLSDR